MRIEETTIPGKPTKTKKSWNTYDPLTRAIYDNFDYNSPRKTNGAIVKASKY